MKNNFKKKLISWIPLILFIIFCCVWYLMKKVPERKAERQERLRRENIPDEPIELTDDDKCEFYSFVCPWTENWTEDDRSYLYNEFEKKQLNSEDYSKEKCNRYFDNCSLDENREYHPL